MKNPKLILQIMNLLNGILLSIYLVKVMGWSSFFNSVKLFHLIILAFIIYGIKSWIEVKFNIKDPVRTNRLISTVFFIGSGLFILGVAFKVQYWPYANLLLISGVFVVCSTFVLSFFVNEDNQTKNDDVIDNF